MVIVNFMLKRMGSSLVKSFVSCDLTALDVRANWCVRWE